ncbi:MAG TPA: TetR/AcrR family transcriptional regulator [Spirochaetia bacterium]|nr:TetR/AcrR family transcriptional regulator [Spirochaetia bacterium]
MPKIFSDHDREVIRQTLIEVGRANFLRFGLRKTSVEQIAAAAGIAKGTFYNFFESKEDLCLAIYDNEEIELRSRAAAVIEEKTDAIEAMKALLVFSLDFVRHDSLLARLRESGEIALLSRGVGPGRLAKHLDQDNGFAQEIVDSLTAMGAKIDVPIGVAAGLMRAMVMLSFHDEEIGKEIFPAVIDRIFEWVALGFTGGRKE